MSDVTQMLGQIAKGDGQVASELLPLVYAELRKLAAVRMAGEDPGQTLQATALVHEAYIRLVDVDKAQHWHSRGHSFAAAAEAMRRILVDNARRKNGPRHGGGRVRQAAEILGISARTADHYWTYAKVWLRQKIDNENAQPPPQGYFRCFSLSVAQISDFSRTAA
jgi:hypothetical protein